MYAIVEAGGRQVRVAPNATVRVDRMANTVGDGVEFDRVLAVHNGEALTVGTPYVVGAKVFGRVVAQGKDRKIRIFTYRPKKRTRRRMGHRQHHTMVQILSIEAEQIAATAAAAEDVEEPEVEEPVVEETVETPEPEPEPKETKPRARRARKA
jgi:large subunit ribosomal protein L21